MSELQRAFGVLAGVRPLSVCEAADGDRDGEVTTGEFEAAIRSVFSTPETCPRIQPQAPGACFDARVVPLEEEGQPVALALGNLDFDPFPEVLVVDSAAHSIVVLDNRGGRNVVLSGPSRFVGDNTFPSSVTTFRKNLDQLDDFAIVRAATAEEESAEICLGCLTYWQSSGDVFLPRTLAVGLDPVQVLAADLDRDGDDDLVVANSADDTLTVLRNDASDGFPERRDLRTASFLSAATAADVDGDGLPELLSAGLDGVTIHRNSGEFAFSSCPDCPLLPARGAAVFVEVADLDGDGRADLLVGESFPSLLSVRRGLGGGEFEDTPRQLALEDEPGKGKTGDFDGNGRRDVAVTLPNADTVVLFLQRHDGTFDRLELSPPPGAGPSDLAVGDLDLDGRLDLVVAAEVESTITFYFGDPCPDASRRSRPWSPARTPSRSITIAYRKSRSSSAPRTSRPFR
ncbi:MAG: hypothetical protein KatS3mg076_1645 [Candidatus Binatia bacterium]|nr:MAG: hypothetical protein KatS3mg076_1645 [Candidatus Binatia bacterium]